LFAGIVYAEKKLLSWKNFGLFGPFFWQKLGTWVLLSSVRVTKKNPSSRSKNIRPKTSDLKSPLPLTTITMDTAHQGPRHTPEKLNCELIVKPEEVQLIDWEFDV
jgi:hypothetical protein